MGGGGGGGGQDNKIKNTHTFLLNLNRVASKIMSDFMKIENDRHILEHLEHKVGVSSRSRAYICMYVHVGLSECRGW